MAPQSGRAEKRFLFTASVHIASLDRPWLVESAMTENVSLFGARILVKDRWKPEERAIIESQGGLDPCQARVVYCQQLNTGATAVGLRLARKCGDWMRPKGRMV